MTKLIVIPALLKAHIDSYTRKDGTFVQAHDDKRQAAKPFPDNHDFHAHLGAMKDGDTHHFGNSRFSAERFSVQKKGDKFHIGGPASKMFKQPDGGHTHEQMASKLSAMHGKSGGPFANERLVDHGSEPKVQAAEHKRPAAQPMSHDEWVSKVKAVHGNVDFKKNAKTGVVSAWSGTSHVGRYKFAQGGEPASHHIDEKQSSDSAHPAVPPHVQKMVSDVAQSSAKPEHKKAAIDAIMSQHAAPGGATNRQAALSAYSEKRKLAGQHGQAALDAAEKARNSKDPAHAAEAISAVENGLNAHKEAAKAARAIPYPGNSSPWEHHDERASALSKMSEEMRQLHQNLSKAAKPRVVMRKDAAPAGSMTPDAVKDHAMKAGAKFKSGVAVFSKPESAHSFARQAAGSKGGAFVMKHPDHSHHVVVNGADAQRMEKNGYQHV